MFSVQLTLGQGSRLLARLRDGGGLAGSVLSIPDRSCPDDCEERINTDYFGSAAVHLECDSADHGGNLATHTVRVRSTRGNPPVGGRIGTSSKPLRGQGADKPWQVVQP